MKKIITAFVILAFVGHSFSQENDLKNFRFGLKAIPFFSWYKPDDAKKFASQGSKFGFGWGLQMEFRLNSLLSLVTGLEVDYDRGWLTFTDTANYCYDTKNQVVVAKSEFGKPNILIYKLNDRYYKTTYLTLPLYLKMKTKEIGAMTYFGEFGVNTSFKLKTKVNDNVTDYITNAKISLNDLQISDDMNLLKFQLHIGAGAEYNLSGTTSLLFGVSYNLGFSNVLMKDSKYLFKNSSNVANAPATMQNATAHCFAITVGVLF